MANNLISLTLDPVGGAVVGVAIDPATQRQLIQLHHLAEPLSVIGEVALDQVTQLHQELAHHRDQDKVLAATQPAATQHTEPHLMMSDQY